MVVTAKRISEYEKDGMRFLAATIGENEPGNPKARGCVEHIVSTPIADEFGGRKSDEVLHRELVAALEAEHAEQTKVVPAEEVAPEKPANLFPDEITLDA